jgi:TrmH family RNA methyltransferase
LLTPEQRERLEIVLVSPRNPLNIGAVARAMANFGFRRLTVVAPYEAHWREARSAVGAPELLQSAREVATVAEAVADCSFVAGTGTRTHRQPDQPALLLPDAAAVVAARLGTAGRAAVVFGPEKHGLTRDDLSYCHALIEIPTDARQPSMNLGQAAAVCLYELARLDQGPEKLETTGIRGIPPFRQKKVERMGHGELGPREQGTQETASGRAGSSSAILDRLAVLIEETMVAAGYSPRAMQAANRHDLRVLLRRLAPSALDTRRMMGLFRRILYRLQQPRGAESRRP